MIWDYEDGEKRPGKDALRKKINNRLEELKEDLAVDLPALACPARGNLCKSFWGRTWCRHLDSFSHWEQRLPRGRRILRSGNVYGLTVEPGLIHAYVASDDLYEVRISVTPMNDELWEKITKSAGSQAFSLLDLWEGRLSDTLLEVLTCREDGLFPQPGDVRICCQCMDWADVCDHGAAVLYGTGILFENTPELLFRLRGIDPAQLRKNTPLPTPDDHNNILQEKDLSDVFGIEIHDI